MSIDVWAHVAIFTHFIVYGPSVVFFLIVGTGCHVIGTCFVPWVELPVQRRLCLIFVSGVGLPDIHEYSAG